MNRRRGFTFVELCLGMAVMAMVATALAGFSLAVTHHWQQDRQSQQLQVSAMQSSAMVSSIIESSRALACVTSSPSGVFLWQTDNMVSGADGKAQFAEFSLIQYDASLKTIFYYQADMVRARSSGGIASTVLSTDTMNNPDYPTLFKTQGTWLQTARPLLGPGRQLEDDEVATRVESCTFTPITTFDLPAVEMNVTLVRGTERRTLRSVLTVRAPSARPDYSRGAGS